MVTFTNLSPTNSITYAPVRVGFGNGTFDSFDINNVAGPAITSIAEGGSGTEWFRQFGITEPNATLGSIANGGPILPGASATATFRVDTATNQFFTFASMVVPSNDLFIGNDNPQGFRLLDDAGNLLISEINQTSNQIWDNGSEVADPANAAFLVGGNNDDRTPENGVVTFDFSELTAYDGLQTAAGYIFDSSLITPGLDIGRFSFSVTAVPEPSSAALVGLGSLGLVLFRRRRAS